MMFKENRVIITFWAFVLCINFGFGFRLLGVPLGVASAFVSILFQMLVFYSNDKILFPKFFDLKDNKKFLLFNILLMVVATALQMGIEDLLFRDHIIGHEPPKPKIVFMFFRNFFWLLLMLLLSTVFSLQRQISENLEHTRQIHEEKLKTELELLKARINPHFLFNALNNIYSLAYLKSDKAPESILELSQMLRYVIEDCKEEKVLITSEIDYINNYINFQKMKSENDQNITFDYKVSDERALIAPMLFIPFIENSFKYSRIEDEKDAYIHISLQLDNKKLDFKIENSIPVKNKVNSGQGSGIKNVERRLGILYEDKAQLNYKALEETYTVQLGIKFT